MQSQADIREAPAPLTTTTRWHSSGVALMLLASLGFAGMSASVKALGTAFPWAEAGMFRTLLALPVVLALARIRGVSLRTRRIPLLISRGLWGLGGMVGLFFALQRGVFANVIFVNQLMPVLVALFARWLLRERLTRVSAISLGISLVGLSLVVKPVAWHLVDVAALAALGGAVSGAMAQVTVRRLTATEHPLRIVLYFGIVSTIGAGLIALPTFVWPNARQWALLGSAAICATAGQLLMTTAYQRQAAPIVAAAGYSTALYALGLGWVFWAEVPDTLALLGGAAILGAGMLLLFGNSRRIAKR